MQMKRLTMPDDADILELTKNGERELREAGTALTPEQLQALVLIDGYTNVAQLLKRAGGVTPEALRARLAALLEKGLASLKSHHGSDILDPGDFFTSAASAVTAESVVQAGAAADANTDFLRKHGYYVNMARSPEGKRERIEGRKPMVLIADDDPDICKLLQMFLKLENIDTRTAANREEIVAALRNKPLPDMVLLDVNLLDVNGFDVLASMRRHPALKTMPVVMLTAEATREAVLKGILGGADGYVTKPFDIHPLLRSVKTVLGLKYDSPMHDWDYSF